MALTYEPIATTTLTGNQNTITFSSIPSTYTDLRMVAFLRMVNTNVVNEYWRFNGDAGTNYSQTRLVGDGSTAFSSTQSNSSSALQNYTYTPGLTIVDIFNYAGSTFKTLLWQSNADANGSGNVARHVGLWRSTSAITSITWQNAGDTYTTGTTITLYGIKAA